MNIIVRILLTTVYSLILMSCVYAQGTESSPVKFTPQQLQEDFQIVRQALEEGHSGIYRYSNKVFMDKMFKQTADSLNQPLDAYEFYQKLAPLVAAVKCGHTSVGVSDEIRTELFTKLPLLPFQVKVIEGKAFVFRDLTAKGGTSAGKELVTINGVPVSKILKIMFDATPADAGIQTLKEWRLSGWRFNTNLISLLEIKSPYNLELRNSTNGRIEKLQLTGIDLPKLQERWVTDYPQDQPKEPTADLKFLQNDRLALLKIRSFGTFTDAQGQLRTDDFIRKSFSAMKAKKSQVLILDLQGNGGGDDELGKLLLSYLINKPFKYYKDLVLNNVTFSFLKYASADDAIPAEFVERRADGRYHAVKHPNWGVHQPQPDRFNGQVYVLINGGSFSTTAEFLSQLHSHRRATFIGEESGGGYYGNSSGFMPTLKLPHTKLNLRVPLMTYYMNISGSYPAARGVIPDYTVKRSIDDYLQERDASLNFALKLSR